MSRLRRRRRDLADRRGAGNGELDRLLRLARAFQLDVLVEVHTLAEMERAVDKARISSDQQPNLATLRGSRHDRCAGG